MLELGPIVTPVLEQESVQKLVHDVKRELAKRYPDISWKVAGVRESLVKPPPPLAEIVDAARSRLLEESWDLVVHVTELPIRIARRPVPAHSNRTDSAALVPCRRSASRSHTGDW